MRTINIVQKLEEMDVTIEAINLGEFDIIGEYTAKRTRNPDDPNFKKVGAFYRSNYERGILIYYLIRQHGLRSMLEIGFGRGYATMCAAKAFADAGVNGEIVTIDPNFDENFMNALTKMLPGDWFKMIKFVKGTSQSRLDSIDGTYDLVYIDGDHSASSTKYDWEHSKGKCNRFTLFDDYHMPSKVDANIQCNAAIDSIDWASNGWREPELIIMDRVIFENDKKLRVDQIDYGQVLVERA